MKSDMENKQAEDQWVAGRVAALAPEWQSDLASCRSQLNSSLPRQRRNTLWRPVAVCAAAACFAVLALLPAPRAIAQRLWERLTVSRIEVIRLDLSALPLKTEISSNGPVASVENLGQASAKLGFAPSPRLWSMFATPPSLSVMPPIEVRQTIRVAALESALAKAGASTVRVPPEWDGVTLRVELKPTLAAEYPDAQILESAPMELSMPAGFPLEHFAEVAFQSIGVPFAQARALGRRFAAQPAWFLELDPDEPVMVEEIELPSGRALLIEDTGEEKASGRFTIIWSAPDRMYAVSSATREQAITLARRLP